MSQPGQSVIPSAEDIDREVRTLKEALRVFLGGTDGTAPSADPKERLRATEWLQSFRRRDDAWNACAAVLGAPKGPGINQVAFRDQVFASQALLYKCRRRRAAITGDDVGLLLRLALGFAREGLRPVLTQLCLGICACAVRHSAWETSEVLPDMVTYCRKASTYAGPSDPAPCILMLELLTVLPDEATARSGISVRPERRQEFLRTLRNGESGRLALGTLSKLMEPGSLPSRGALSAVLKCALGWVQIDAVESGNIFGSPLISLAFEALGSPEACDEACDLLTHVMEAFMEPRVVEEMLSRVLSKRNALLTAPCEDTCRCLASVFAAAACVYHRRILQPELACYWESLLQIMLNMLEHLSLEMASLALEFWGLLGQFLSEASARDGERRIVPLEEAIRHACLVVILRARNPAASEGGIAAMDDDAREELDAFREQAEDMLQTLILPDSAGAEGDRVEDGGASSFPPPPSNHASPGFRSGGHSFDASTSARARLHSNNGVYGNNNPSAAAAAAMVGPSHLRSNSYPSATAAPPASASTLGGAPVASNAVADGSRWGRAEMVLSPVQSDLLAWLEGVALACTEEAPLFYHQLQQQHNGTTPGIGAAGTSSPSGSSSPGFPQNRGGGLVCGSPGGAVGNGDGGADWPHVEVLLRMLSAVARALVLRDVSMVGIGLGIGYSEHASGFPVVRHEGSLGAGAGAAMETLVERLPRLPPRRDLQRSAAVLIGASAEWLARRPRVLEPALKTLLGALDLEEEGRGEYEASMRNKGEDHVGAVALAKLVSSAGPSLASIPSLPKHLLDRYLGFSAQLRRYRLRPLRATVDIAANSGGCNSRKEEDEARALGAAPKLHAGSLKLFLGSLCQILGDVLPTAAEAARSSNGAGRGEVMTREGDNGMGGGGRGVGEARKLLRMLMEEELRCLEQVLDRRRVLATVPAPQVEENRAMADLARDSLSHLSLVLRKTSPRLNAPELLARCCGLGEVLVGMVGAFGPGEEERVLPHVCQLFEAIVWSTAEWMRYTAGRGAGASPAEFNINGIGTPPHPVGRGNGSLHGPEPHYIRPEHGNPAGIISREGGGGMRLSVVLGDVLVEAFLRRPFVRFLEALRCITKELFTFESLFSAEPGDTVPDVIRACEWVDRCFWFVRMERAGTPAGVGVSSVAGGIGGGGVAGGLAADAHPEMVEALFRLMTEWVKERPGPSVCCGVSSQLEAWMYAAVAGLVVRHRGPARAVLGFLQACCSQNDNNFKAAFSTLLRTSVLGVAVTRGLLSAMCGAMPSWMLEDVVVTFRSLFDCFMPAAVASWVDAVLQDPTFERFSVSKEAKVSFSRKLKEDVCCKDWRAFKTGLKAFCGGKKKGNDGTPPVHASAI